MTIEKKKSKHIGLLVTFLTVLAMILILFLRQYFVKNPPNTLKLNLSNETQTTIEEPTSTTKQVEPAIPVTNTEPIVSQPIKQIKSIDVGDELNDEDQVKILKTSFNKDTEAVYVTAYIEQPDAGDVVSATLFVETTQQSIGPVITKLQNSGDAVTSFAFYKPEGGWTLGAYKLTVYLSSGQEKSINFYIEE